MIEVHGYHTIKLAGIEFESLHGKVHNMACDIGAMRKKIAEKARTYYKKSRRYRRCGKPSTRLELQTDHRMKQTRQALSLIRAQNYTTQGSVKYSQNIRTS